MATQQEIAKAYVTIGADLTQYDQALATLPTKAAKKIDSAMQAIRSKMASTQLKFVDASMQGDAAKMAQLGGVLANLKLKMDAITNAARLQGAAATAAAFAMISGYEKAVVAAHGAAGAATILATANHGLGVAASKTSTALVTTGHSGTRSAMGLMALSNAIEDAEYGFHSIVNNLALMGNLFTSDAEKAIRLGVAFQLTGVAINTWIKNWDQVKEIGESLMGDQAAEFEGFFKRVGDAALTASATISEFVLNSGAMFGGGGGIGSAQIVNMTTKDLEAKQKQQADAKARTKEAAKAFKKLGDITSTGDTKFGVSDYKSSFGEAVGKIGGGTNLEAQLKASVKAEGGPEKVQKLAMEVLGQTLGRAMEGDPQAIASLIKRNAGLGAAYKKVSPESKEIDKEIEHGVQQLEDEIEDARKDKEAAARIATDAKDKEATRLSKSLESQAIRGIVPNREADVRKQLEKAGVAAEDVGEMTQLVMAKLREAIDEKVQELVLEKGMTPGAALSRLNAEETEKQRKAEMGEPRQVHTTEGTQAILKNMQVQVFKQADKTPAEIRDGVNKTVKVLEKIESKLDNAKPLDNVPRFRKR